jgi:hypothetical protein
MLAVGPSSSRLINQPYCVFWQLYSAQVDMPLSASRTRVRRSPLGALRGRRLIELSSLPRWASRPRPLGRARRLVFDSLWENCTRAEDDRDGADRTCFVLPLRARKEIESLCANRPSVEDDQSRTGRHRSFLPLHARQVGISLWISKKRHRPGTVLVLCEPAIRPPHGRLVLTLRWLFRAISPIRKFAISLQPPPRSALRRRFSSL